MDTIEKEKATKNVFDRLKELLDGVGTGGWGRNILESFIEAEINKRT